MIVLAQRLSMYLPSRAAIILKRTLIGFSCSAGMLIAFWLTLTGRTRWAGRSLTLLDPTYASKHIPIIASVSEHQAPIWTNYFFDMHICSFFAAVGLWMVFANPTDTSLFGGLYGIISAYFSSVMVRLMLVLSPAFCSLGGLALSYLLASFISDKCSGFLVPPQKRREDVRRTSQETSQNPTKKERDGMVFVVRCLGAAVLFSMCAAYVMHSVLASALAYSHPSIIQSYTLRDGSRLIHDDFREAYYWMRKNTHKDARFMSWWDYGYQSAAMANRSVIVDNNTWNTTHIATVGLAFASPEEKAYPVLLSLDVDYVFVVFGGHAMFSGDDINKFLWMVRIAEGPYPWITESSYFNKKGAYSVGEDAADAMKNSLLYRLTYLRFAESFTKGHDNVRHEKIPSVKPLKYLEEVYTTENWIVRVYKVKRPNAFHLEATPNSRLEHPY